MCACHSLIQFKVVHWIHLSKAKLSKTYSDISPTCDKYKSADGTLIHIYWLCPSLEQFWKLVFDTLSQVLQCIPPDPMVALFSVPPEEFASLRAHCAILLKWKEATSPTHFKISDLISCLNLEKIRFSIRGSCQEFYHFNLKYFNLHLAQIWSKTVCCIF